MKFLKDTFFILFIIYYVFTIIDLFKNKDKKSKNSEDNSKEIEDDTRDNCIALYLTIFIWFVIIVLITFIFKNIFALELNSFMIIACSISFLFLLIQSILSKNYRDLYSFDQFNSLSVFCIAIVVAVSFQTHNFLLMLIQNFIKNTDLQDVLIILFFFAAYFVNIFFIFTLSSSLFFKLKDNLLDCLREVILQADKIKKTFHLPLKKEKDKKHFSFTLKIIIAYFKKFLSISIYAALYLILRILKILLRFLIGFSSNNDILHLSFYVFISVILSLIFSYIHFTKIDNLINKTNYKVFEFVCGTILIPLIYECINRYADKVKSNLKEN